MTLGPWPINSPLWPTAPATISPTWQQWLSNLRTSVNSTAGIMTTANGHIGFYGVTPVARQLLATGAGHSVDDVIAALQALGLVRQV